MLRLLHLNKRYWPHLGGIERYLDDLAAGLAARPGVAVSALVCSPGRAGSLERRRGVLVEAVPSLGTLWSLPLAPGYPAALRRHLAAPPSLVHLHEPFPLGVLAWLWATAGSRLAPPLVVTWHSDIVRQRAVLPLYGLLLWRLLGQARAIIVPTAQHIASSRFLPAVAHKCRVIPFGIAPQRYQAPQARAAGRALRQQLGARRVVLFVGRLVYYKGLPFLLRAMAGLDATLVLVGAGGHRAWLERLARQAGIAGRVHFAGAVPDEELPAYYQACDVFVLPSTARSEGFGIVQLEAMASGKPVVSTALPTGVAAVNRHGETGLVVPPGDSAALAAAITALLDRPDWAAALGRQGQRRVAEQFSLDSMVDATLALYQEVIAAQASPAPFPAGESAR